MLFLQYGVTNRVALKIWKTYGDRMYTVLKENPYQLAEDIYGIGFATADEIAGRVGISTQSEFRIRSGILYTLSMTLAEGSSYLPRELPRPQSAGDSRVPGGADRGPDRQPGRGEADQDAPQRRRGFRSIPIRPFARSSRSPE